MRHVAPPEAATTNAPFALVTRISNALRLSAVDKCAARLGLAAGMALADARARHPALATLPHDVAADARALARLAAGMARFTPLVSLDPPDGLVLDITGCAHLFGGEAQLAQQAAAQAGFACRHAFADHAAAARALVRYGGGGRVGRGGGGGGASDIRTLPLAALELSEDALAGLRRAGLRTLGDLARRPTAGLAARFGEEMVARLRAILGETARPITPRPTPVPIRAQTRFAEPIARTDTVLDVLEALLVETGRQMAARQLGGRRFAVTLERSDGARRCLTVDTGRPTRDPATIMRLFAERIDNLADPIDPGFGFDAITLSVPRAEALAARQATLEHQPDTDDTIAALIDRLSTRLGPDRVRRLIPSDTYIPEKAQYLAPATQSSAPAWPVIRADAPRPLVLFDPPQPITAIASVPDGPPQRFRWRGRLHDIAHAEGPERIAPEWWRRTNGHLPGQHGLTRDYYRVEDADGRRFWLLRHGLFDERSDPLWYIHGLFA
jgi:protein ImuB